MIEIHRSSATKPNEHLARTARRRGESNVKWLARVKEALPDDRAYVLLLGGTGSAALRLRMAQALARDDMRPSHWSHVAYLDSASVSNRAKLLQIPLDGTEPLGFPPTKNGLAEGSLKAYDSPKDFPNVALLGVPVSRRALKRTLTEFSRRRAAVDAVSLQVAWLAYLWGVGDAVNPLVRGDGVPAAAMIEYAAGAVDYELTPGLASRQSCPEAIWQAAKWWHDYHEEVGADERERAGKETDGNGHLDCLVGAAVIDHRL